uniref:Arylacetamide deacetylase-like 4 n=2 Tax=Scophthalmus maximus TaxID=52904 RepID=A0A8D3B790_SCOMX
MERLGFFGKRLITFDSTSFKHVGGHHYFFPGNRKRNQGRTWAGEKEAGSRLITFTPDNSPGAERSGGTMDIGSAILIIGLAALAAAFLLLVIGLVYSELMNSDVPRGVANSSKLHMVHGLFVGIAIVGRILHRLGICHQVSFIRWFVACFLTRLNPVPVGLRVKELTFSEVPVRVYEPTGVCEGLRRGLVYFHGGGWVLGSIDSVDEVCRHIAIKSDSTVVSVGYRLAPEHRYPAQLDDCEAATCHFLSVAEADFSVDPRRVAVGGDSTGANLAAALCQRLARREDGHLPSPCAQILVYPALQMADFNLPSYQQNQAVPILFRGRMVFYFLQYLSADTSACQDVLEGNHVPTELRPRYESWLSASHLPPECLARGISERPTPQYDAELYHVVRAGLEPEVSPLLADDDVIRKTPPTFLLTCEFDVLRDDGILYRKRLLDLKRDVAWQHVRDGFHGMMNFFNRGWLTFPSALRPVESVVDYVKTL